jgi:methionyl-tRNA formyltransferase
MGNPKFAINPLKRLLASNHDIVAVISNPPKPMGRKKILQHTDVGKYALDNNLNLIELDDFDNLDIFQKISSLKVDIFVVVAFRILPKKYIELPKFGSINIHASLLPKYRGAAPIQWALMNGDNVTGVSIFQIEKKVDTGGIIHLEKIKIQNQDNFETLSVKLSELGSKALLKSLRLIENDDFKLLIQDNKKSTRAPKIKKEMLRINWSWNAEKIKNWVRGLSPFPSMYTTLKGKKYKIFKIEVTTQKSKFSPGRIEIINLKKLIVHTFDHKISILDIQKEGKKRLLIKDFLKGSNINHGDYFT